MVNIKIKYQIVDVTANYHFSEAARKALEDAAKVFRGTARMMAMQADGTEKEVIDKVLPTIERMRQMEEDIKNILENKLLD